jgi:acetolactate synthase-1/2/3 large subunit
MTSPPKILRLLTRRPASLLWVGNPSTELPVEGIGRDYYQKDAFQEFDLVSMFRPVTKLAAGVNKPERIPDLLRAALRTAMCGRRGPVFLEIPRDILGGQVPEAPVLNPTEYRTPYPQSPHPEAIREVVGLLRQAERPLLLIGGGVTWAGANDLVSQLSERYLIPMITAYRRNDAVPSAHPLYVGALGRAASPEAAAACRRADLLLVLGSRLARLFGADGY